MIDWLQEAINAIEDLGTAQDLIEGNLELKVQEPMIVSHWR